MSAGAPLIRAAVRLAGWAKQARGLADDAQRATAEVRRAQDAIEGIRGFKAGDDVTVLQNRLRWSFRPMQEGARGFHEIVVNIIDDSKKTLKALDRALANPNISQTTRSAMEAKRQALAKGIDAIQARDGIQMAGSGGADDILIAIMEGRTKDIPALIERTHQMLSNALQVSEQTVVALEEAAALLEAEAIRAAARASVVVGAGATVTTLTASEAQASYSRDNTDLAAGTYDQVNLDGAMLGLIVGVPYEAWAKAADQHALNQAKYNAELNVDAFIGESRQVDDARFESTAPSIRTIPDQKALPIKSKSKVVWELAEEGKNLPASNQPLPSIVPRG